MTIAVQAVSRGEGRPRNANRRFKAPQERRPSVSSPSQDDAPAAPWVCQSALLALAMPNKTTAILGTNMESNAV